MNRCHDRAADRPDLGQYEDRYRSRVLQLIEAKVAGEEVVASEEEEGPQVVNLMDALKKSVARARRADPERRPVYAPSVASRGRRKSRGTKRLA